VKPSMTSHRGGEGEWNPNNLESSKEEKKRSLNYLVKGGRFIVCWGMDDVKEGEGSRFPRRKK